MKKSLLLLMALAGLGTMANADLVHRYQFNGNANDSIGTAHGTLGTGTIADGKLTTDGSTTGVNLPVSAINEITTAFTIETWVSGATSGDWQTLFAFDDGTTSNFIICVSDRGDGPVTDNCGVHILNPSVNADNKIYGLPVAGLPGESQITLTYDGTTFKMFTNGELVTTLTKPGVVMSSFVTSIDINSSSPWPDPSFRGSTHDFRIYNNALSEAEVTRNYTLGADASSAALYSAYNPSPADNAVMVGSISGSSVTVDLSWNTAKDPANPTNYNSAIKTHYLYMSSNEDANLAYVEAITASGATGSKTVTGLDLDKKFKWRIDEGILLPNGTTSAFDDPNTIPGLVWTFDSLASVPVITSNPQGGMAKINGEFTLSVDVESMTSVTYTWKKSADNIISEDDTTVGGDSNELKLTGITTADRAYYYCVVVNSSVTPVNSALAYLDVESLIAHYAFEDSAADTDVINTLGDIYKGESYNNAGVLTPVTYGPGRVGNALILNSAEQKSVRIPVMVRESYTIEMWLKTTQTQGSGGWWNGAGLVDGEMPGGVADFGVALVGNKFANGSGPSGNTLNSTTAINTGEWIHCVASRDMATGTCKVYINGHLENKSTADAGVYKSVPDYLTIGKIRANSNYFNGALDEIKIYNYAMSDLEVAAQYVGYVPEAASTLCIESDRPTYDIDGNCKVDITDFALIASQWLNSGIYDAID